MNFLLHLCIVAGITTTEGAVRLIEKKKNPNGFAAISYTCQSHLVDLLDS